MFALTIDTENDAFQDGRGGRREIARILRELADRLTRERVEEAKLRDVNGNTVGEASFS